MLRKESAAMAVAAVLLAIITMLGHRAHTEEVLLQTRTNDQWDYYQAKNNRSEMYTADAKLALLMTKGQSVAAEFTKQAEQQNRQRRRTTISRKTRRGNSD